MAEYQERPTSDPFCSCPEVTFSGGPSAAEMAACRAASGGVTHRVIDTEDLAILLANFKEREARRVE